MIYQAFGVSFFITPKIANAIPNTGDKMLKNKQNNVVQTMGLTFVKHGNLSNTVKSGKLANTKIQTANTAKHPMLVIPRFALIVIPRATQPQGGVLYQPRATPWVVE